MKKILILFLISIFLISCSTEDITGTYIINTVNDQTIDEGGLKSLIVHVNRFKEGEIDIVYSATDTENKVYQHVWEKVKVDNGGNITETLSNSEIFYITGNFSKSKCDLNILDNTKSKGIHLIGEKQK